MTKSITERIFGTNATIKIFDYLLDLGEIDCTISDIAEGTKITRQHVYRIIKTLMGYNIILKTRIAGGTQMYDLNKDNDVVKSLLKLNKVLLKICENGLKN